MTLVVAGEEQLIDELVLETEEGESQPGGGLQPRQKRGQRKSESSALPESKGEKPQGQRDSQQYCR